MLTSIEFETKYIDIFDLNLLFIHMLSTTFLYDLNKDSYILDL